MGVTIVVNICQCCHAVFQTVSTAGEYTTMEAATSFFPSNSSVAISYTYKRPNSL